jgi:hypothetical protein
MLCHPPTNTLLPFPMKINSYVLSNADTFITSKLAESFALKNGILNHVTLSVGFL